MSGGISPLLGSALRPAGRFSEKTSAQKLKRSQIHGKKGKTMTAKTTILTRLFAAPRELVFECWLKPEHLLHWYSAGDGWTTPYAESDPKTGGRFKIGFAAPAGPDGKSQGSFDFTGTYTEVKTPE